MAAEAAEVDIQNTHTINAMDSAAEAETEEDFDRVSSKYFPVESMLGHVANVSFYCFTLIHQHV